MKNIVALPNPAHPSSGTKEALVLLKTHQNWRRWSRHVVLQDLPGPSPDLCVLIHEMKGQAAIAEHPPVLLCYPWTSTRVYKMIKSTSKWRCSYGHSSLPIPSSAWGSIQEVCGFAPWSLPYRAAGGHQGQRGPQIHQEKVDHTSSLGGGERMSQT